MTVYEAVLRRFCAGAIVCVFVLYSGTNASSAESKFEELAPATNPQVVYEGAKLERSRRWVEAIRHYEQALKNYPDNQHLKYGLRRSRINFSIARRYNDLSFEDRLLEKTRYESLTLFDDVLMQIRSNYVDPVSHTSFVAHGTESLYLALNNGRFVEHNLPNAEREDIQRVRKILRNRYWNKPIASQREARRTIEDVCTIVAHELRPIDTAVVLEYVYGGCNALDDYSNYLTPDRLKDLYGNIEGNFVGLGIEMKAEPGKGMFLMNVLPDSPAEEGGLRAGHFIVSIDETDCTKMTTDEAAKLLRGVEGSRVHLRVHDPERGRHFDGMFSRRAVIVKSIPVAQIVDQEQGIGYIQMTGFQQSTPRELDAALSKLNRQGMRGLIWDLRGNPGGLLTAAVEVLDRFIDQGVLVSTKGRVDDQNYTYSAHRTGTWNTPIVLLVDENSASASEIVAGAIRDHRRGVIVGRKTFGKWSVQTIFNARHQTGLRLTTAKFYSPRGRTYGKIGLAPDVTVDHDEHVVTYYRGVTEKAVKEDPDLKAGIGRLSNYLSQR